MRRSCVPISGSHQHGPPLLGRVRTPPRSRRQRSYAALRLPRPPRPPLRSSLANGLPRRGGLVLPRRTGASACPCNAGDTSTPAPHSPALSRGETRASQVPGPSSSCVPCSSTRRVRCAPRPATGAPAVAFRPSETLSTRNAFNCVALPLTAHSLACLRFAQSVTVSGARLATGRAGSPLAGRVSHPLDDIRGFMVSSHTPILLDQPCLVAPKAGIHAALTEPEQATPVEYGNPLDL